MSSSRSRCSSAFVGLIIACCGTLPAGCSDVSPASITFELQEWRSPDGIVGVQILTEHYDIRVTTSDETLRDYLGAFMETAFAGYSELISPARTNPDRMVIYLFGTRPEWSRFVRARYPAQAHTYLHIHAGGFVDQASGDAVTHDIGRERTLSLIAHEGFHQYARHFLLAPVPPWLNEGLATQFEAFDLPGDRPVPIFLPERNFERKQALRSALRVKNGMIPLERLIAMHAGEAVVKTGQTTRSYYAQVWSLILFLREGADGEYSDRFDALLADAGTARLRQAVSAYRAGTPESRSLSDAEIVLRQYITDDLTALTTAYEDFNRYLVN